MNSDRRGMNSMPLMSKCMRWTRAATHAYDCLTVLTSLSSRDATMHQIM